jgi:hypothetical protein
LEKKDLTVWEKLGLDLPHYKGGWADLPKAYLAAFQPEFILLLNPSARPLAPTHRQDGNQVSVCSFDRS